jgi:serine phosphatase RsbU (regulator of sigma subunit)/anti-sigma regulatory factor (Ser/Thr protein kinase)
MPVRLGWPSSFAPRDQVLVVGLVAGLLQLLIVYTALAGLNEVDEAHRDVVEIGLAQRDFQDADMAHDAMQARMLTVVLETSPQRPGTDTPAVALVELEGEVDRYRRALTRVASAEGLPRELKEAAGQVRGMQEAYAAQVLELGRLALADPEAARAGVPGATAAYEDLINRQNAVTSAMSDRAVDLQRASEDDTGRARLQVAFAAVATLLGLVGLIVVLGRLAQAQAQLLRRQRGVVETLQHSLLPDRLPDLPGMELAVRYLPGAVGAQVGGDWYDVVQLPGGEVGLVMGDVVGHDLHAATEMGQLRSALRAYAAEGLPPDEVLRRLNRLCTSQEPVPMATVLYAVLDPVRGSLRVANAGHCPPLIRAGDECYLLEQPPHPPIGAVPEVQYTTVQHPLPAGCLLVLYTDGLVERRGLSLDEGLDRLCEVVVPSDDPLEERCSRLVEEMLQGEELEDDMALMLVAPQERLGEHLELQWEARMDQLAGLRRVLERWLAEVGADEDEAFDIVLSCAEAATNAVEHAYGPSRAQFRITCDLQGDDVVVTIRDWGRWRPPRGSDRGRGLTMIHALMDDARVEHGPEGTEVCMRKRLASMVRT